MWLWYADSLYLSLITKAHTPSVARRHVLDAQAAHISRFALMLLFSSTSIKRTLASRHAPPVPLVCLFCCF
jgi:hypothetical protein